MKTIKEELRYYANNYGRRDGIKKYYEDRQSKKLFPWGNFRSCKWLPFGEEKLECCKKVRLPSRNFPYSYLTHCKTLKHIKKLFDKYVPVENIVIFMMDEEEKENEKTNYTERE
jgi:hypothetical protein